MIVITIARREFVRERESRTHAGCPCLSRQVLVSKFGQATASNWRSWRSKAKQKKRKKESNVTAATGADDP